MDHRPLNLLALLALLIPGAAHADPISIFSAILAATGSAGIAGAVATAASFLASYGAVVGLVAINVYGAAAGRRKAKKDAARQRAEYNASLQDRSITALSANPPWRIVYGRCITGGDVVAIFTTDKTGTRPDGSSYTKPDALKHLVIVLAAHQVHDIHELYIDGVPLGALDGSGWVTAGEFFQVDAAVHRTAVIAGGGSFNAGAVVTLVNAYSEHGSGLDVTYTARTVTLSSGNTVIDNGTAYSVTVNYTVPAGTPRVRWSKHLGTDSQTVDTYLNSVAPTEWDSSCRLRGLAYVAVTLDLEEARFQGGPPGFTFDTSGRLAYDQRTSTTAWTQNNAVLIRDWLMAPWGYACDAADIDTALHNAAANACDVAISLDIGGTVTTGQPTYTCNGAFSTADSREAVLEDLCESMAGFATYGATWGIVAGAWTSPVMDLTDDDLDGQIEIVQAGAGMDAIFNGLRGQYIAAGKSSPSDFDSYKNAAFAAADGQELWTDITLPFTNNKARARNLARVFVERNRDGLVIRFPAKLRAWPLQIGDRVTVTSAEYGFSAKTFRVTDWQFGLGTAVQLTLQEDNAAVYDLADAATADPAPNTALPNPWSVVALTGVGATSGIGTVLKSASNALVPRVLVEWDAVTDAYVADGSGSIELLWQRPGGPLQMIREPGNAVRTYIVGANHGDPLVIEVRARNGLGKVGPSVFIGHTVNGALGVNWDSVSGRPKMFRAVAKGYADTLAPVAPTLYDAETGSVVAGFSYNRSFNMARIRRSDGAVTFGRQYDVYGVGALGGYAAADLAADLNATGTDHVVAVWTFDDPSVNRLTGGLEAAMYRCGASRAVFGSPQFKARGAYILVGIGGCGEGNGFEAYNGQVASDTNAWCDVAFYLQSGQLVISGTSTPPRTLADHGYVGTLDATTDLSLVATGLCLVQGNSAYKSAASNTWGDAQVYSRDGFVGGAFASAIAADTTNRVMFGLNSDPTTDANYTSIDHAIYLGAGTLYVFESGSLVHTGAAYAVGDVFAVAYDGYWVRYLKNGAVVYSSAAHPASGTKFHFDSSFYNAARINMVRFGPLSTVAALVTGQLAAEAATKVYLPAPAAGPASDVNNLCSTVVAADSDCKIVVTATGTMQCANATGSAKFKKASFALWAAGSIGGGGTAYGTVSVAGNIANGETQEVPVTAIATFDGVVAGDSTTFSVRQSNHGSASIDQQVTGVSLRIEVIKR